MMPLHLPWDTIVPGDFKYDCRKINVARNIQVGFFQYYRETIPHKYESDLRMSVSMILLNYGPKVDKNLENYEVEIFAGFIC